jgi:response regulator RpfG family c-di-GMP phosphodiesterase
MKEKKTILVVEDNQSTASYNKLILERNGYYAITVNTGLEAINRVNENNDIDLILMDIDLGIGLDGIDTAKEILKKYNIPIVFLSSETDKEVLDRIGKIESYGYILKTPNMQVIITSIKSAFQLYEAKNALKIKNEELNKANAEKDMLVKQVKFQVNNNFQIIKNLDNIISKYYLNTSKNDAYNFETKFEQQHLMNTIFTHSQPEIIILIYLSDENKGTGKCFKITAGNKYKSVYYESDVSLFYKNALNSKTVIISNENEKPENLHLLSDDIRDLILSLNNSIILMNEHFFILAGNYPKEVEKYDADVLKGLSMQLILYRTIRLQSLKIKDSFRYTASALARAAEGKDNETGNHINRVSNYSLVLAKELSMPEHDIIDLEYSSKMHDVGKINIDLSILLKPGPLNESEFLEMENHTIYGALILGDSIYLKMARDIALSHHERWDGTGYPYGLKMNEIPISALIVTLADIYDALRSKRSYKPAFSHDKSCKIILEGDGRVEPHHFNPDVLKAFRNNSENFAKIYEELKY